MAKERDELLDHEYDGIREYDNPLPQWWLWLFYGSIVFAAGYIPYIVLGFGPSSTEEYQRELAAAKSAPAATAAAPSHPHAEGQAHPTTAPPAGPSLQGNAAAIAAGKEIYVANCAPCHAPQGQGLIGPNLTDNYWKHGNTYGDVVAVVTNGVPDKGMIAWKATLNPQKIQQVSAFVLSLKGTNPPNPKAPEGTEYK